MGGRAPGRPMKGYKPRPRERGAACPVGARHPRKSRPQRSYRDVARRLGARRLFGGRARLPVARRRHARPTRTGRATMIGKLDMAATVADARRHDRLAEPRRGRQRARSAWSASAGAARWSTGSRSPPGDALDAGVSFYGPAPDPAEAARVEAPMLLHPRRARRAGERDRPALGRGAARGRQGRSTRTSIRTSTTPSTTTRRRSATTRGGASSAWARDRSTSSGAHSALADRKKARRLRRAFPLFELVRRSSRGCP